MVRLLKADTHFVLKLDNIKHFVATVESDPEPVCAYIVDDANLKLYAAGEDFELVGDDVPALEHVFDQELDALTEGIWNLVIVNESPDPVALHIELIDENDLDDDDDEEEEDEDDEEEDDAPEDGEDKDDKDE